MSLPHVHVNLKDGREGMVAIDSLEITGRIGAREIREERAWIASQRFFLHAEWQRLNP
jgi:hypothetical protein